MKNIIALNAPLLWPMSCNDCEKLKIWLTGEFILLREKRYKLKSTVSSQFPDHFNWPRCVFSKPSC